MSSDSSWQFGSKRRESYPDASLGRPKRPPPPKRPSEPSHSPTEFSVLVLPLSKHTVRWFYCEPGKQWQPFEGRDSLALEEAYGKVCSLRACRGDESEKEAVEVMGDMFEVCVRFDESYIEPIYWNGKPWKVIRGTWFEVVGDRWFPIPTKEAEQLEEAHCSKSWREKAKADRELQAWANASPVTRVSQSGSQSQKQASDVVVLHRLSLGSYDALWVGENDVLKVKQGMTAKLFNTVGEKVTGRSQTFGTTRLVRGYKEPASLADGLPPIGHLVFVVHGIGQNMESADIVKSTSDLRNTCAQIAKKRFLDRWSEKRVEFIPVEWRTCLCLDGGVLAGITPHGVKALRNLINDSFLDTMYYLSPRYGPEMLDGLRWQLHKLFDKFMGRHPGYLQSGGSISLFGHSLGSVMCYDLLHETAYVEGLVSGAVPASVPAPVPPSLEMKSNGAVVSGTDQTDCVSQESRDEQFCRLQQLRLEVALLSARLGQGEEHKKLRFRVDHLFAVGSPLALFIMMREHVTHIQPLSLGASSFLPSCVCCRIHNLHHPSDPVAYRLEPLVNPLYAQIKPVKIGSASSKPSQEALELAEGPKAVDEAQPNRGSSSWWNVAKTLAMSVIESNAGKGIVPDKLYDNDSQLKPEDRLKERLDFMLREGIAENSYLNTITAHTCYWTSSDCANYVLLQVYSYRSKMQHQQPVQSPL